MTRLMQSLLVACALATPAVAAEPSILSFPFSMGNVISLGPVIEGPVALQNARFRMEKGLLQAEIYATCAEGKDQEVVFLVELIDEAGKPVATLHGKGGVEEEDDATLKARTAVSPQSLALVRSFTLRATARPD